MNLTWQRGRDEMTHIEMIIDYVVNGEDFQYSDNHGVLIRCRDCIHHHYEKKNIPYCDRIDYGYGWKDGDFCSHGEKRDG